MLKTEKKKKNIFNFLNSKYKSNLKTRPTPALSDTKKSFIKFIKPFLDNKSDTEFHEELINDFISDEGNKLQKKLAELSKVIPSWHYDLMMENYFLKNKKPIPFFSNYIIVYDLNFKDQIDAFAKLILSCIFLKRMIQDEKIRELTMKDHTQYFCLFHSCRIPNYELSRRSTGKGAGQGQDENKELERNKNMDLFDVKIVFDDVDIKNKNKFNNEKEKEKINLSFSAEKNKKIKENQQPVIPSNPSNLRGLNQINSSESSTFEQQTTDTNYKSNSNSTQIKLNSNTKSSKTSHSKKINENKNQRKKNFSIKESLNIFDYDENKFVVVLYKNIFWLVETSLDYEHLSEQLLYITSLDLSEKQENFIGVLTGADRNQWAKARHKFMKISPKNQNFIFYVERALMIFCICDSIYDRIEYNELFSSLWFNELNNRFFDKVLQVIVFKDGTICLNIEKSAVDVSVAVEFLKFVRHLNANDQAMQKNVKKQSLVAIVANKATNAYKNISESDDANLNANLKKKKEENNYYNKDTPVKNKKYFIADSKKDLMNINCKNNNKTPNNKNLNQNKTCYDKNKNNSKEKSAINKKKNFLREKDKDEDSEESQVFNVKRIIGNMNYFENFNNKPVRLNYDLTEKLKLQINATAKNFRKEIAEKINSEIFIFKDFGKFLFERKGVDMAGFIQLAVLSAHYRTYGKIVASRQFVCGRHFRFGIAEFVRTTVKESVNFMVSLNELRIPRDLKVKLGQDFFKENKKNVNDVLNGKSLDVHFAGLNFVNRKNKEKDFESLEENENKDPENKNESHIKSHINNKNIFNFNNQTEKDDKNILSNDKEISKNNTKEIINNSSNSKDSNNGFEEKEDEIIKEKSSIQKILSDEIFKKASDFVIETYPIINEHVKLCLQGYVNAVDGLSITYVARKDHIQFNFVSANDLRKFIQALEEILYEMKDFFLEKGREYQPKF